MNYDVVTFGDMCVDLLVTGKDVTPRFGQVEKMVDNYLLEMGGSCCIFACQAARLGLRVGILGRVGDDDFGRLILRRLKDCGVDTQHIFVDKGLKTGLTVALSQGTDRAILTYSGTISSIQPEDIHVEFLASARHLHHGSFYLHTGIRSIMPDIFRRARSLGLTTSLDPNWDPDEHWNTNLDELLALTDICMPNEQEATAISQMRTVDSAAEWLQSQGVSIVAIKSGQEGAQVYQSGQVYNLKVPAASGGDSTGAGDCFDAGFLAGWLRGIPIDRCLSLACACGTSVASAIGGLLGQLNWETASRLAGIELEENN